MAQEIFTDGLCLWGSKVTKHYKLGEPTKGCHRWLYVALIATIIGMCGFAWLSVRNSQPINCLGDVYEKDGRFYCTVEVKQ